MPRKMHLIHSAPGRFFNYWLGRGRGGRKRHSARTLFADAIQGDFEGQGQAVTGKGPDRPEEKGVHACSNLARSATLLPSAGAVCPLPLRNWAGAAEAR